MIQTVTVSPKVKVKLTIPLISSMLSKGYKVTEIARMVNCHHSWVSKYIANNYDDILPLIDNSDTVSAFQAKYLANKFRDKLEGIIDSSEVFTKRDLIPCIAGADQMTKQYRLLSDKSTSNVSIDSVERNVSDLEAREREINERLSKLLPS